MDLIKHLARQRNWSTKTFGAGKRTEGLIDHIQKELEEIRTNPNDIEEWINVVILALDGAWRVGYTPVEIADAIRLKQSKNEQRIWPDWREAEAGKAIKHIRA